VAKISALGALGENYLEIGTGTAGAPLAPSGSVLPSKETMAIADLGELIGGLAPTADQLLHNLNDRVIEMKVSIASVNDLLNDRNRKNVAGSLHSMNGMLAENRPVVKETIVNVRDSLEKLQPIIANVQTASDKLVPMLDDLTGTIKQANDSLAKVEGMLEENRPDIREVMGQMKKTLAAASVTVNLLQGTLDRNTDNLVDVLVNLRETMENMNELTDALRRNPSLLIRGETARDRKPGSAN
jgi:ABC-type transporter Mla subunit MlaD